MVGPARLVRIFLSGQLATQRLGNVRAWVVVRRGALLTDTDFNALMRRGNRTNGTLSWSQTRYWPDGVTARAHRIGEVFGVAVPSTRPYSGPYSGPSPGGATTSDPVGGGIVAVAAKAKSTTAWRYCRRPVRASFGGMAMLTHGRERRVIPFRDVVSSGVKPVFLHQMMTTLLISKSPE